MSVRLYVGNLPKEVERQELVDLFAEFSDSVTTKVITDRKTGKCRGFGFITAQSDEIADQIIEKFNGHSFKDSELKIEKANPRAKGKGDEDGETPDVSSSSNARRKGKSSSKKSGGDNEAVQPDPRWAQELEKLKSLLATQTANS
ncbi:RNA recognition motif domain-containing protein [Leptolyngbya sp. AN02str]|uniref:RNA recognition motif domain-containing protein n=1 Tax=Leptolyngbya sp. AN02str TaxID=3423363 RepID=UPI003D314B5C